LAGCRGASALVPSTSISSAAKSLLSRPIPVAAKTRSMLGFTVVQPATNSIELADLEFARKAKAAGLNTLYLQFDGVTDDVYIRTRSEELLETKMKVIENCRANGMKIVFVPTEPQRPRGFIFSTCQPIVKGLNDHHIGDIVRVAVENIDTV
jgi:uncharacterized radical SAM superfamily Fe-S cluster-containing enzyme